MAFWNDRADLSRQRRELVQSKLDDTYHQAHGAESGQDLRKAREMLHEVLEMLKDKTNRMLREDHDACWEKYLSVKETIHYRWKEICDFNYGAFKHDAYQAKGWAEELPRDAKAKVREVHQAMKGRTMEKWQFDEIRGILDEAYDIATAVLERRQADWQRRQQERQSKHEAWQQGLREAKSRKLSRIDHLRDIVAQIERDVDRCRDLQRDARSSEFADRVQVWIDEKYDKIRDIEHTINDLEDSVRDIDSKLD
ncbi:MAG: hypothetical protein IT165_25165 [Bryobacterales bacterium]|nr:hypothetical protein [Bryobacterales bacterium]